jgi:SAM-dependent methyltransferase
MQKAEYTTMAEREKNYWWHLGRLRIIERYISRAVGTKMNPKLLNVGCGTGGTIDMLEKYGTVDNVDISDEAIKYMKGRGYSRIKKVSGIALPYSNDTFEIVGAFDVLEHIEDQVEALAEWKRVLKPGGKIIITVPAYQWLWTAHDVSLHHKRRYTTKRLRHAAEEAGLEPDRLSYAIVFSFLLIVGFRFLNKFAGTKTDNETSYVNLPCWVNSLFSKLLYFEAQGHTVVRYPFGTSVVGVFSKQ